MRSSYSPSVPTRQRAGRIQIPTGSSPTFLQLCARSAARRLLTARAIMSVASPGRRSGCPLGCRWTRAPSLRSFGRTSRPSDRQPYSPSSGRWEAIIPRAHWYLPLIGVDPFHQRKGYGSALLRHVLRLCDRDGTPAYLESTNPANVPLYERHGFRVLATSSGGVVTANLPDAENGPGTRFPGTTSVTREGPGSGQGRTHEASSPPPSSCLPSLSSCRRPRSRRTCPEHNGSGSGREPPRPWSAFTWRSWPSRLPLAAPRWWASSQTGYTGRDEDRYHRRKQQNHPLGQGLRSSGVVGSQVMST